MRLTPRRRLLIAMLATAAASYLYLTAAAHLVADLVNAYNRDGYANCATSWRRWLYPCKNAGYARGWAVLERGLPLLIALTALFAGALVALLLWVLRPIRAMSEAIRRLGPANPGERLRVPGGSRDPIAELGRELDLLMDRVADGYEGQRRFAANASHELRTPLAIQRTLIEVSMSGQRSADQLELLAEQLLGANERNEALVEGLLVLAETDRGLMARGPVRLDEVADTVLKTYVPLADAARVTFDVAVRPITVDGEQVLIERLIGNLVHNGIKYNHPGGLISVEVGHGPKIVVTNTGPAVPGEALSTIFEPFRRLSGARIGQSGGSGLGLTIARSIASAHGGTISAWPRDGGGLRMEVAFPPAD